MHAVVICATQNAHFMNNCAERTMILKVFFFFCYCYSGFCFFPLLRFYVNPIPSHLHSCLNSKSAFPYCEDFLKLLNPFLFLFPYLQNGDNNSFFTQEIIENEVNQYLQIVGYSIWHTAST